MPDWLACTTILAYSGWEELYPQKEDITDTVRVGEVYVFNIQLQDNMTNLVWRTIYPTPLSPSGVVPAGVGYYISPECFVPHTGH